ncbi:inactive pancreatic lipase-related protein 1-like [Chrysoperla carnea]|uniref:inactive pancreatic lipase-related protein 1-like n=1 Tax=Chrysoperla carnea TaxID=189513 RepID=UPI001D08D901|nr:inactive pancreatic lipase-related protein 1-like [Chrysoperla carnea]
MRSTTDKREFPNINTDNIIFNFYNSSASDFIPIPSTNLEAILDQEYYDPTKNILFFVAGQATRYDDERVMYVLNHYIKAQKYNVLIMNYLYYSHNVYDSFMNVRPIGKAVSGCVMKLMKNYGVSPDRIELHGHSVGATIVAWIARYTVPKVGLLVGMDPGRCGGVFRRGYAQHTISLRTDAEYNGDIVWDSDTEIILNNGVRIQPGCEGQKPEDPCSHAIAFYHWVYMISNPELFYAVECNEIKCNYSSIVANIGPDFRQKGTFYLRTAPAPPYGMGLNGIKNIIPTKNSTFRNKGFYIDNGQYIPPTFDICYAMCCLR